MLDFFEHSDETSGSIKGGNFFHHLGEYRLLTEDYGPRIL
jgi:hypothetical protein